MFPTDMKPDEIASLPIPIARRGRPLLVPPETELVGQDCSFDSVCINSEHWEPFEDLGVNAEYVSVGGRKTEGLRSADEPWVPREGWSIIFGSSGAGICCGHSQAKS
jgi:hypothetical protein